MDSDSIDKLLSKINYGISCRDYCVNLHNKIQDTLQKINPDLYTANPLLRKAKQINDSFSFVDNQEITGQDQAKQLVLENLICKNISVEDANLSIQQWIEACDQLSQNLIKVYNFAAAQLYKQTKTSSTDKTPNKNDNNFELRELNFKVLVLESLLGKTELTALPSNLQIEPSDRCNAKCKPCPHCTTNGWVYNDLDTSVLKKLDGMLSGAQFVEIFALGEPSIAPSFDEISELISGYGCETHIITNGATLNSNKSLANIKKIGISIDGDNQETFETIRTGLKFKQILKAVEIFRQDNPDVFMYFTATINRANIDEIPGIALLAKEYGMNAVCFHRMSTAVADLSPTVLKQQDIPFYRAQISEAEKVLEESGVLLFDYALLDKLRQEDKPLNKLDALQTFKQFDPNHNIPKISVQDALNGLDNKILMPLPSFIKQPGAIRNTPDKKPSRLRILKESSEQYSFSSDDTIEKLKIRLSELQSEISTKKPEDIKLPYCMSAWFRFILKADGRMFPCSCWSRTYENINNVGSFEEAWNNQFMKDLRKAFTGDGEISKRCSNCVSIDRYQGLTELLYELHLKGISYEQVSKLANFDPPPGKLKF